MISEPTSVRKYIDWLNDFCEKYFDNTKLQELYLHGCAFLYISYILRHWTSAGPQRQTLLNTGGYVTFKSLKIFLFSQTLFIYHLLAKFIF